MLRDPQNGNTPRFRFGPYEVDLEGREIRKHGQKLKLPGQSFTVLAILITRPGEIITREELRGTLWSGHIFVDFERGLNSAVKKLRAVLQDSHQEPRYIETIPRMGYRFIAKVNQLPANQATVDLPAMKPQSVSSLPVASPRSRNSLRWFGLIWTAVAVLFVATYGLIRNRHAPATSTDPKSLRHSVAVLGFNNLSGDLGESWLSTAFAEMLSTELAIGEELRTIPEENVARAKKELSLEDKNGYSQQTLNRIRKNLGSDYVIDGAYLAFGGKENGQVRLDLRLQDSSTGETVSSVAVTGQQTEIFHIIEQAAVQLRTSLGASNLSRDQLASLRASFPSNTQAERLYSQGVDLLREFDNLKARHFLQDAISLEPNYAMAHAALALAWRNMRYDSNALSEARLAFDLSNALPQKERLIVAGLYYEQKRDWASAIQAYRQLAKQDDIDYGIRLATVQISGGYPNDALATLAALRKLPRPLSDDPRIDLIETSATEFMADYRREIGLAEQTILKSEAAGAGLLEARSYQMKGTALDRLGNFSAAKIAYLKAQDLYRTYGDQPHLTDLQVHFGMLLEEQGDLENAKAQYKKAGETYRASGDHLGIGVCLSNVGSILQTQGDSVGAEKLYRQALVAERLTGMHGYDFITTVNLGEALALNGKLPAARRVLDDLLASNQAERNTDKVGLALSSRAQVMLLQGDLADAIASYRESLEVLRESGNLVYYGKAALGLADAEMAQGRMQDARDGVKDALNSNQQIGAKGEVAIDHLAVAEMELEDGSVQGTPELINVALKELKDEKRAVDEIDAYVLLVRAFIAEGKIADARAALNHSWVLAANCNAWKSRFDIALNVARVAAAEKHYGEAIHKVQAEVKDAQQVGCTWCELQASLLLAETYLRSGNGDLARTQFQAVGTLAQNKGFGLIARKAEKNGTGGFELPQTGFRLSRNFFGSS